MVQACLARKPGQVSGLVPIEQAYTIVRLNAHNLARKRSFDDVKASLRSDMQKAKYERLRVGLDKKLRANAKIEIL